MSRGCGGCDPSAIEFVIDDNGTLRPFDPARDMKDPTMTDARSTFHSTLAENWRVFRRHQPVGAYLPVGQLDGDCRECGDAWPCLTVRSVIDPALDNFVDESARCRVRGQP